jgi:mRNA interferase MazF
VSARSQGEIRQAEICQGDIWWAETPTARRPVLVVTRTEAIPVLTWIVVAPVTSTIRGIPTEVPVGQPDGLDHDSVANFDDLRPILRSACTARVGALDTARRTEICSALRALADC